VTRCHPARGRASAAQRLRAIVSVTLPLPSVAPRDLGLAAAALVIGVAFTAAAEGAMPDAYGDAFARSAAFEQEGDLAGAARALELILPLYPQDEALPLQIAWIYLRAERPEEAERFYRVALARSPRAVDARLGLANALEATERCDEARPILEELVRELPDLAPARDALGRCASFAFTPSVALSAAAFPGNPYRSVAGGVAAGMLFAHRDGFFLGGLYRFTHFAPPAGAPLSPWDQHEGYFSTGYEAPLGGIAAHYAVVHDGSGALGTSQHVGISARWSPFGDIEVGGSASFYDDLKVLRVEPSWRIPIAGGLSIQPGAGLADAGGAFLPTGMATIALDRSRFGLYVGGKYGDELRPVYFSVPVVYDLLERVAYGAWGGVHVNVSDDVRIHVSYAMDRLKEPDGTSSVAHTFSLGAAAAF
jgi:hypothetical protein